MLSPAPIRERTIASRAAFDDAASENTPFVMRGLIHDWPLCAAARTQHALAEYLRAFDSGEPVTVMGGPPAIAGRLFYMDGYCRLNFQVSEAPFPAALSAIFEADRSEDAPTIYIGSAAESRHWPGLARANPMPLLSEAVVPNLWIGTRAVVGAHNDFPDNLACVVAGQRRFRVFPPEQFANLYVGPLELNPAGRPVSFVAVDRPDLERYPRYAEALTASREAVLGPGDALFIPSMWWHSVESLAPFNLLVNYWWEAEGASASRAESALIHALLAIAPLAERHRNAWRAVFDHLVFRREDPVAHIPVSARGLLGELTPDLRDKMKSYIRRSLAD